MPGSAEGTREAVESEVRELERLCNVLEAGLVAGDWVTAANALRDSRRTMHAFLNAIDAAAAVRDETFDRAIHDRMQRVFDVREDQLARLQTFHGQVGERLQALSRWKSFARSIGAPKNPPRKSVLLDRTQ